MTFSADWEHQREKLGLRKNFPPVNVLVATEVLVIRCLRKTGEITENLAIEEWTKTFIVTVKGPFTKISEIFGSHYPDC